MLTMRASLEEIDAMREHRSPKEQLQHLLDGNMRGRYLDECLESCRWGSAYAVMWETTPHGLTTLIASWKEQNDDDRSRYSCLEQEPIDFALPYQKLEECPHDKHHAGTVRDHAGFVYCGHVDTKLLRAMFLETFPDGRRRHFVNVLPPEPPEGDLEYAREIRFYEAQEPSVAIHDPCYALLDETGIPMPLETVLSRLDIHNLGPDKTIFPFSGRGLVKRLASWEESTDAPLFAEGTPYEGDTKRLRYATGTIR